MRWGIKVVAALVLALCLAPASVKAAAPANDDFANSQALPAGFPGGLPIEETGTNVGATHEEGESLSPFAALHSIWFEWEAGATGWVTVGACGSDFPALIGVFTGTELSNLARAASGNAAEGPESCASERKYTFKATAGASYSIAVDGNAFYPPFATPPVTEGEVVLRIEATPPPPNDAFADAEAIEGKTGEEPGGARFYVADLQGYNWGATSEPGEFTFGSSPVSSVWYRWTAPETATYRLNGPCCGGGLNWALFGGGSFGEENEMVPASGSAEVGLVGGTEYWIDVYGALENGMTEPRMGSFGFLITASLPSLPPAPASTPTSTSPGPPPDTTAPETKIDKSQLRIATRSATFWFSASESVQGFFCRLDKGSFKPCGSPRTYKHLKPGGHAFRAIAVDGAGNVDGSAAVAKFKIPKPSRGRR
jgi:hypothetical protein